MKAFAKKAATAGAAVITASAIAFTPSVQQPAPDPVPAPSIRLTAQVTSFDPFSIPDWVGRIVTPPSLGAAFPAPPNAQPPVINLQNIDSTVKAIYGAVEPWVRYGFQLAEYAVGWIPWVGWLAPQVMYFYNLGERIVSSAIFNTTEWLTGQGNFIENLGQFGVDTVNSFIYFANDQLAFWLPPLPPIPPLPGGSNTFTILDARALPQTVQTVQKRVTAPVDLAGTVFGSPGNLDTSRLTAARVVDAQVTNLKLAAKPSPAIDTSNPLRKVDPFNITTDILKRSRETTTTPGSRKPLLDPFAM